jgi:hypothetical protein
MTLDVNPSRRSRSIFGLLDQQAQAPIITPRCEGVGNRAHPSIGAPHSRQDQDIDTTHSIALPLDGHAWEAIDEEATRAGSTIEDLITFSVLYYLADIDSGRIARRITSSSYLHLLSDSAARDPVGAAPPSVRWVSGWRRLVGARSRQAPAQCHDSSART